MLVFTTRSGTTYEVDTVNKRLRRVPRSAGYPLRLDSDGEWQTYETMSPVEVGYYVDFMGGEIKELHTTSVTEIK